MTINGHRPLTALFYAVGRKGLGQTVRAIRLASCLHECKGEDISTLVVTGVRSADRLFHGVGHPSVRLVSPPEIVRLTELVRSPKVREVDWAGAILAAAVAVKNLIEEHVPDIFVSTSHRGVAGELATVGPMVRSRARRKVLALRDIYWPTMFITELQELRATDFDSVVFASTPATRPWLPDALLNGELAALCSFVGYLAPAWDPPRHVAVRDSLTIDCQVGGGSDGLTPIRQVMTAIKELENSLEVPVSLRAYTGPFMPESDFSDLAAACDESIQVSRWHSVYPHRAPDLRISMAGYNAAVEAAWSGCPTLLIPRASSSEQEQLIRARLFSEWFPTIWATGGRAGTDVKKFIFQHSMVDKRLVAQGRHESELNEKFFADSQNVSAKLLGQ